NLLGARCGRRRLDDYVHPGDEALDFAGVAQISLVPLDRIRAEGRTPMPYCVEFDIGSLGQMLDEIAADEARRPADQYFAPGHPVDCPRNRSASARQLILSRRPQAREPAYRWRQA